MDAFKDAIADAKKQSDWDGKPFLPVSQFKKKFTREEISKVFKIQPDSAFNDSIKVIAIFLYIGRLEDFEAQHRAGLRDKYLPVEYKKNKNAFEAVYQKKTFPAFSSSSWVCDQFFEGQWLFLAPVFSEAELKLHTLHKFCPLPIIDRGQTLGGGTFGEVSEIKIHHAHLKIEPQPTEGSEPILAIKKLTSDSLSEFEQEEEALSRIQKIGHDHLIKVIASIKRGKEYLFIFPLANGGDLRKVWKDMDQDRRTGDMVGWAFEQMKGIASAISMLHNPSRTSKENGRHGDLRPENILLFKKTAKSRGILRITDVGLARFHNEITSKRISGTVTMGGSREYAPPEALSEDENGRKLKRSRKYDMWSLGCIFLEFLVWVLGGTAELEKFKKDRETRKSMASEYFLAEKSKSGGLLFQPHPQVRKCILAIRKDSRCKGDTCFWDLLNVIEKSLLQLKYEDRTDAEGLEKYLGEIYVKSHGNSSYLLGRSAPAGFDAQPLPRSGFSLRR